MAFFLRCNDMDQRVKNLKTVADCKVFAQNARELNRIDLANQARERTIELNAQTHSADSNVEREGWEALYAYEEYLSARNGKKTRAIRQRDLIKRRKIVPAIEQIVVNGTVETEGFEMLLEAGLLDYSFESTILRHPESFSANAATVARARLSQFQDAE